MTMRLRLAGGPGDQVAFGCSPAQEALRSLHVLHDVRHHPLHISWVLRTRARLTGELRDEVERFGFWWQAGPLVFPRIWPSDDVSAWPEDVARLRRASAEDVGEPLVHLALLDGRLGRRIPLDAFRESPDLQRQAVARIEARQPASVPVLRELIADPDGVRERFTDFLGAYWRACLAPDWPELESDLRDDLAHRGRALSRRGLPAMLAELSPRVSLEPGTANVLIQTPGRRRDAGEVELTLTDDDQILLVPSHFRWPELTAVVQLDQRDGRERRTVLIVYALAGMQRAGRAPIPPEDLLKLLRAAGDPTRLQILQLLAERPRSTREIAGLIGLTEAAISKQLKLLHGAGWVSPQRQSYYVYYRLRPDARDRLSHALDHLLG